jgi:cytochrome c-type biogenesis protein
LPCVGPTLGTAIALASTGQNLLMSFIVMLTFGIGTAIPLFLIGRISKKSIPYVITKGAQGRKIMAYSLLFLAIVLLTKFDRVLEGIAINYLPSIFFSI